MSNEELVAEIQKGSGEKLPQLWEQVERFAAKLANRWARALDGVEFDDLYQSGYLALVRAVETYDTTQGMKFIGWYAFRLKSAFLEAGGRRSKRQQLDPIHSATSLDLPLGEDSDGTLADLVLQVMDNMMLVLAALPLFLYANSVYGAFRYRIVRILCALDMGYILLAILSQFLGLWDFHQTLNGAVASYGIVDAVLLFCLVKQTKEEKSFTSKSGLLFGSLQRLGILLLGLGLLGDLIRYLMMDVLDRAFIIRIGLLCFIICFGAGNIYQMTLLVKKGLEAEFISQLAYSDGLTKIGNRTAYLERLQHLIEDRPGDELGLVMFDINDLKRVNDTLGHKSGDELLLVCADILQTAFGPPWNVYRIGGDEFMALIHGKEVRSAYETAVARFIAAIGSTNGSTERDYSIAIAHGAAFSAVITQATVDAVEKEADLQMYKNKYQLKLMQE